MTRIEAQRIHAALEEARGDHGMAAAFLGKTVLQLDLIIARNKELKLRWDGSVHAERHPAPPVSDTDALSKAPTKSNWEGTLDVPVDTAGLLKQMEREDRQLRDGLVRINLTPAEADVAAELAMFHKQHFVKSIHIIGAGVTRMSIKVQTQLENLERRIGKVQEVLNSMQAKERTGWVMEERMLYESYHALVDELRRMFEIANRSALIQADIMFRMKGGRPIESKPGFANE